MENGNYDKEVSSMGSRSSSSGNGAHSRAAKQPFSLNKVATVCLLFMWFVHMQCVGSLPLKLKIAS